MKTLLTEPGIEQYFKSSLKAAKQYRGGKARPGGIAKYEQKIYKLSSNENPLGPSPKAMKAIQRQISQLHEYPDNDDERLRVALSQHYAGLLERDHFISGPSASELIEIIMRGFLQEGDELLICSPTFLPYRVFAEKLGATVVDVPLLGDRFVLDLEGAIAAINDQTRLIFLGSPNNPTGQIVSEAALNAFIQRLPSAVILVLDEVYHQFVTDKRYCQAVPFVKANKNVIGLNSFSKAYGLAGLRLGYAYAPKKIASYLRLLCKPFYLSSLAINAGIAALSDVDFIKATRALILQQRHYLQERLCAFPIKFWPSQGNFILFKLPISSGCDFEERMLGYGIMIRPVEVDASTCYFRVSIGKKEAMDAFLTALRPCLL